MIKNEVIYSSEKKETTVEVLDYEGGKAIVKKLHSKEGELENFRKEIKYYKFFSGKKGFVNLLESGDNFFVTQFVGPNTALKYLSGELSSLEKAEAIDKYCHLLNTFNSERIQEPKNKVYFFLWFLDRLRSRVKDLLFSGPKGHESTLLNTFLCRALYYLGFPVFIVFLGIVSFILCFFYYDQMGVRYHGDFHQNNILVNKDGDFFLIDFENAKEMPGKVIDFGYCIATARWLLGVNIDYSRCYGLIFSKRDRFLYLLVSFLVGFMTLCSRLNTKFGHGVAR